MKVYLDYAATSPVLYEVRAAILPFLENNFGNPSSIHQWGRNARAAVDKARKNIAKFLNCQEQEVVFTSGGTEADNLAIRGLILGLGTSIEKPHIITSQIEHHAVLNTCKALEKEGLAEITYIKPDREGIIRIQDIKKAIKKNTVLVSIMYVNNEIGTIQPICEIGKMIERENQNRKNKIYFHSDTVQAVKYLPMDVNFLHVDLLTISGHKIGAPKGIGALYIKKGTSIKEIITGGEQEMGFRAGTENVAGIVALGKAIELIKNLKFKIENLKKLRNYFIGKILKEIPDVELNGSKELRSPNNANFYFKYIEGESILLNLDLAGIAASSGSACTSQSLEPSHVLLAVYENPERAHGSIRFSLGPNTTKSEIDYVIKSLKQIVEKLRKISPLTPKEKNA